MDTPSAVFLCGVFPVTLLLLARGFYMLLYVDRKLRAQGHLYFAAAHTLHGIAAFPLHIPAYAYLNAGLVAANLYLWWGRGGGDGLRKLGRSIRGALTPRAPGIQPG